MQFLNKKASSDRTNVNTNFHEQFYDGTLRTEDGSTFRIHKILLAQRSDYFRALFSFEGNNITDILVKEIGSQTLRQIIHYLYERPLHLNEDNVLDLMIAADFMLLDDLMEQCREFAIRHMTPNNCMHFLTIAAKYEQLNIFRECSRYVKIHFEETVKSFPERIGDLPLEVLTQLLKDNALNVTSEYIVWMAIAEWIKVDPFNRDRHVPGLLSCIRSEETDGLLWWWKKMVQDPIVTPNPLRIETNSLQVTHPSNISGPLFLQKNLYRESVSHFPKYLHVVVSCGVSQFGMDSGLIFSNGQMHLTYDEELDYWRKIGDTRYFPDAIVSIGKYIYLFQNRQNILRYDLLDEKFIQIRRFSSLYYDCCVVELNQKIYVLGKWNTHIGCYNPDNKKWKFVYNPVRRMIINDAVAMHARIYMMGHVYDDEYNAIMVTQVYDPITDIWNIMESPRVCRREFSVVAYENRLYLIGGKNNNVRLKNVEEYDPVLDTWTSLPDLPFFYVTPKAVVVAGRIMVFENCDEDMRLFEVYPAVHWDGVTRTWQVTDRSFGFYNIERYRFCILDDPIVIRVLVNRSKRSALQWDRTFFSNEN